MRKTPLAYSPLALITACLPQRDGRSLVRFGVRPHVGLVSDMPSTMTAHVENRYPSPLARSMRPLCGPRQLSPVGWDGNGVPFFAYFPLAFKKRLAQHVFGRIFGGTFTQQRAKKCVKQFSLSLSCPQQPSQAAWKTKMFNVPLSALALAVSQVKSFKTANASRELPLAQLAARCSTTCNSATPRFAHGTLTSHHQRFPSWLAREPFSIGASPIATLSNAQGLPALSRPL